MRPMPSASRPVSTATAGSSSRGKPMVLKSLSWFAALVKSPTSIEARSASLQRQALQFQRQRAERALDGAERIARVGPFALVGNASARHNGASFWLPTAGPARSFSAASGRPA